MLKKKIAVAVILTAMNMSLPAFSKNIPLEDIKDLPSANVPLIDTSQTLPPNHWAYKTLQNISKKYGVDSSNEKFSLNKPLTRNEAAYLLVSLTGKIDQNKIQLTDFEKGKLESVQQELQQEIDTLKVAVNKLETSVETLKGSVSKLQKTDETQIKTGYGKNFQLTGSFQARYAGNVQKGYDNYAPNFRIPMAELGFKGKLTDHLDTVANFQPGRYYDSPSTKTMIGDLYISTNAVPHHTFYLGQTRIPIGYDGTISSLALDTIERSQIARNLSDKRDLGIKVAGNWTYFDYYAGLYNGSRYYSQDSNNDMDVAGWINFKPFAKLPQLGSAVIGSGYTVGKGTSSYDVLGLYTGYKYKKFGIKYEYATSKGATTTTSYIRDSLRGNVAGNIYNNAERVAKGWYVVTSYDLTPKLQLLARFDQFDPDVKKSHVLNREYTIGANYFLHGPNLKLQLNYVLVNNQAYNNSQRVVGLTQYAF